ncbi:precorrin-8X methylmutase [Prochlorococcus marinus XMU1406]|uniref:precorrin-8X methylmutase n=1 Tax=Prochlorococcus marinus TaxID=1219 RepID=UPI001AD9DE3B|nr:precorrin-8X methylmutase [Prochlorococcus marinus]MBO8207237.1 precorrin-8X methylmutase [Prochlorococcus marinus XMU1406]MCR8543052.1 precorrin-8X methylmutase [Prochlorococcus marinus XMU1427]
MVIDHPIFLESIKFIRSHLGANDLNYLEKKVLERLVHTSGDFSVQNLLEFSEGACEKGIEALKNGAPILTDTDMAAAAIKSMAENTNRNKVFTARRWFQDNNHKKLTKTAYGLSEGWKELSVKNSGIKSPIIVIGSSPTALTYLIDLLENAKDLPSLIVGMPVGFIGVEKSKNKLVSTDLPRIVLNSTRGGAAMAAAAVNALLRETI